MRYYGILNLLQSSIKHISSEEESKPKAIEFVAEIGQPNKAQIEKNALDESVKPDLGRKASNVLQHSEI